MATELVTMGTGILKVIRKYHQTSTGSSISVTPESCRALYQKSLQNQDNNNIPYSQRVYLEIYPFYLKVTIYDMDQRLFTGAIFITVDKESVSTRVRLPFKHEWSYFRNSELIIDTPSLKEVKPRLDILFWGPDLGYVFLTEEFEKHKIKIDDRKMQIRCNNRKVCNLFLLDAIAQIKVLIFALKTPSKSPENQEISLKTQYEQKLSTNVTSGMGIFALCIHIAVFPCLQLEEFLFRGSCDLITSD
eukprot:sb/3468896/